MCVTDRHDMTLAVKVALNPNSTNQPTNNSAMNLSSHFLLNKPKTLSQIHFMGGLTLVRDPGPSWPSCFYSIYKNVGRRGAGRREGKNGYIEKTCTWYIFVASRKYMARAECVKSLVLRW